MHLLLAVFGCLVGQKVNGDVAKRGFEEDGHGCQSLAVYVRQLLYHIEPNVWLTRPRSKMTHVLSHSTRHLSLLFEVD